MAGSKANLWASIAAIAVLFASTSVAIGNFDSPAAVHDGLYSDHFSHMCSTILFAAKGLEIYRKPVQDDVIRSTQAKDVQFAHANRLGTKELFVNPLDARRPPLAINWSFQIRPYPPGVYALFLPVAALFQFQVLSFSSANRAIILFLVAMAGLSAFLLFRYAFQAQGGWDAALRFVSVVAACYWIQCWAVRGFYDVVSILFVLLSLWTLERRRWLNSVLFYCCAVFLHYRALYYAPVPLIAVFMAWREAREHERWFLRGWIREPRFWFASAMVVSAGVCFVIALPQLESFAGNNPLYHFYAAWSRLSATSLAAIALACVTFALMVASRDWLALSILGCYCLFLARTPQTYPWHSLFLAPLVVLCSRKSASWVGRAQWASTLLLACWLGRYVFQVWTVW